MNFCFITLFPSIFDSVLKTSILGRSLNKRVFSYSYVQIRDFALDEYGHVDDKPYGGGPGMLLKADVLEGALRHAFLEKSLSIENYDRFETKVILMSASGKIFDQKSATESSKLKNLFIVCGHYEGVDQRFVDQYVDQEVSIGKYILTGGEVPALAICDSIVRLLPNALGAAESSLEESYSFSDSDGLLPEYPQYTRPEVFNNSQVPTVLLSGNHQNIKNWRLKQAQIKREKLEQ